MRIKKNLNNLPNLCGLRPPQLFRKKNILKNTIWTLISALKREQIMNKQKISLQLTGHTTKIKRKGNIQLKNIIFTFKDTMEYINIHILCNFMCIIYFRFVFEKL